MQNKTDKKTSLVSKSLPVRNFNFVNCLFSERKKKYYVSQGVTDKKVVHFLIKPRGVGCFTKRHYLRIVDSRELFTL